MQRLGFFCLFLSQMTLSVSAETLPGPIPAEILRVVDGDTVQVRAHIWVGQSVEIMVRVADIDAPEVKRPQCSAESRRAKEATEATRAFLGDVVFLRNVHNGKYAGRVVAELHHRTRGRLSHHLLTHGLAIEDGEDDPWCAVNADRGASK